MANSDTRSDQRPSPEELLKTAQRENRGRLKIFLGAAPGVGKTFEMLLTAQARRREGVDVVVGVVETHGRIETDQLLNGLAIIPRRQVEYRGLILDEMDLDAILARRPKLVLVDELAHTNVAGSRHPKRYLDAEELLAAGIDVFTTLNIQHVESLNDVVARITRIRVRETVPDGVLDAADDIEVVDIAPDDLIQRVKEGKVYVPKTAQRALDHYFAPGNLTALRELALRRTAQRVDEQLLSHMRRHAIRGPWAAGERVVVCLNESEGCAALIRQTKRMADRLHAPWTALYVATSRTQRLTDAERDRIADWQRLAERLGGEAQTVPGLDVVEEILRFAGDNNVTQIIVGKSNRSRWFEMVHGSVVHDLVRRAGGIGVHVSSGDKDDHRDATAAKTVRAKQVSRAPAIFAYVATCATVGVALAIGLLLQPFLGIENVDLIFLLAVVFVAGRYGLWPSIVASVVSVLAYNFFFLPPLHTFTITNPAHVLALVFFLAAALVASHLAGRVRDQAHSTRLRARTSEALFAFSRKLAGVATLDDLLWAAAFQIASMLKLNVVILVHEDNQLVVHVGYPPEDQMDGADLAAAHWTWKHNRPAGRGAETLPGGKRLFIPIRTSRGPVGVIGLDREQPGPLLTPDERRLLDALLDQTAVAIERVRLAKEIDEARLLTETERLRSALLMSISHDLSTPLASILGAATSLQSYDTLYDAETRRELIATLLDEGERLHRFVRNLLDMTRLESGVIELNREIVDVGEAIGAALERCGRMLIQHRIELDIEPDLPMLSLDAVLLDQVIVNLLDNASKYTPAGSTVTLQARRQAGGIVLHVRDEGPGMPEDELERVFTKFHRLEGSDRKQPGTGLGLAVCRGFVEAMGGTIVADNRSDRSGAVFTLTFPEPQAGDHLADDEAA
ncbi:MAG: sensor histidine kinase KdpD [Rhodospirillales bacterium]|nr:sensor histidine kinase KdpD [Rhodospirillales bacterium]